MDTTLSRRTLVASMPVLATGLTLGLTTRNAAAQDATPAASPAGDGDLASRLRPLIEPLMKEMLVPGAVVLARTPNEEFFAAFGTRVLGENIPVTTDDHFRIGSNTKTMTGTVVLQLVQEGLISLTDPVSTYRPDVPNGANIPISMLLDMSSGLANYSVQLDLNRLMDDEPGRNWTPEELVAIGLAEPPAFGPGKGFLYSNTNTVLLGLIVEKLTGEMLADVFTERIFTPLGLTHTIFPGIDDATIPDPHPQGYGFGTNVSTIATSILPEYQQAEAVVGTLKPNDWTDLNPSWAWAAGAASSTASDLATYVEALVGGGLLNEEMQATRLASIKPQGGAGASYGLALAQFGPMIGHDGTLPGFQSFMGHDPATGSTLIVLSSMQISPDDRSPANEIARPLIGALAALGA
jgi:D-alanyl-D-alanine carboxypeptidase